VQRARSEKGKDYGEEEHDGGFALKRIATKEEAEGTIMDSGAKIAIGAALVGGVAATIYFVTAKPAAASPVGLTGQTYPVTIPEGGGSSSVAMHVGDELVITQPLGTTGGPAATLFIQPSYVQNADETDTITLEAIAVGTTSYVWKAISGGAQYTLSITIS
jgi:hypothetical protein